MSNLKYFVLQEILPFEKFGTADFKQSNSFFLKFQPKKLKQGIFSAKY